MYCLHCSELSIESLITYAIKEVCNYREFPLEHYYNHQPTLEALKKSSEEGCRLCGQFYQDILEEHKSDEAWVRHTDLAASGNSNDDTDSTQIKLAIRAFHLSDVVSDDGSVDQPLLYDTIVLRVGHVSDHRIPWNGEPDDYRSIEYTIYRQTEPAPACLGYAVGRVLPDSNLSSQRNFQLVSQWLNTCSEHINCPPQGDTSLPNRVLDTGTHENFHDLRLLVTNGLIGQYLTLSHCWGGRIIPLLTTDNLQMWQHHIPFEDLPANFRDAIIVTRQLGLRYLWIDALCIVQDSVTDWETESKHMGRLYRTSFLTISAASSQGSREGFLKDYGPLHGGCTFLPIRVSTSKSNIQVVLLVRSVDEQDDETLLQLHLEAPLHQRGWCFQESVLAPRVLTYGRRQIYFQCPAGFQSADGVPTGTRDPLTERFAHISSHLHDPVDANTADIDLKSTETRNEFYVLVERYSHRLLSYGTDKFPAFSGLAESVSLAFASGEYVAGIWTSDIATGLAWYETHGYTRHVREPYRAPSWSWAITDDPIQFNSTLATENSYELEHGRYDVKLESFERVPRHEGVGIYGQLDFASLLVKARVKKLFRSNQRLKSTMSEGGVGIMHYDELEEAQTLGDNKCFVIECQQQVGNTCLLTLHLGSEPEQEEWIIDENQIRSEDHVVMVLCARIRAATAQENREAFATGLALKSIAHPGHDMSYERVGYLDMILLQNEAAWSARGLSKWLETWDTELLMLV